MINSDIKVYASQSDTIQKNNSLANIEAEFKQKSRWYSTFFKHILPTDKNIKIIDVPCGHGNILYFLKSKGYTNYVGYDIDSGRIKIANNLGLNGQLDDGLMIIKNQKDVDVIFSLDFLEHIDKEHAIDYVQDCYNSLKSGGILIIRMPITDNLLGTYDLYNDLTHKWSSNSNCIAMMIQMAGFNKVQIKDERPVLYKWSNYIRYALFFITSNLHNLYLTLLGFPRFKMWSRSAYFIAYK